MRRTKEILTHQEDLSHLKSFSILTIVNDEGNTLEPKIDVEHLKEEPRTNISEEEEPEIKAHTVAHDSEIDNRVIRKANMDRSDFFKADEVGIQFVDKSLLVQRESAPSTPSGQTKSKNSAYFIDDVKSTPEKKRRQRKWSEAERSKLCRNRSDNICDEQSKSADYSMSLNEASLGLSQWSGQQIKQEDVGLNDDVSNEKLPINLSLKNDQEKNLSLLFGEDVYSDQRDDSKSRTTSESYQSTKVQPDTGKHTKLSESSEVSSTVSKTSEKSCRDDLIGSENDMIREDPVCIYCYKKLPKDISNIIEHCRLCVYMLRPINIKYMCYMCLYNTHCRTGIKRHIMRHLNIRPYTCSICPFSGIVSRSLKLHMKTHSMEQLLSLPDEKKSQQTNLESGEYTDDTFDNEQTLSSVGASESSFTGTKKCDTTSGPFDKSLEDKPTYDTSPPGFSNGLMDPIHLTNSQKMDSSVSLLSEHLIHPMRAQASDSEQDNVLNDSNNNVNNNASHLFEKLDTNDAIDLRHNYHTIMDTEVSHFHNLNKTNYSGYGNNTHCNSFEGLSLKSNSFSEYLMLCGPERVNNGALDYCLKKST